MNNKFVRNQFGRRKILFAHDTMMVHTHTAINSTYII